MNRGISKTRLLPALVLLALSGACAGATGWEDVLGGLAGMGTGEVRGEVDRVDTRGREIQLRTSYGQSTRVQYDSRTRVLSGQRRYSVGDLARGDVVSMNLQRDRYGELYTDRIYLESRGGRGRDRADRGRRDDVGRVGTRARYEGRADRIDTRNGRFQLADTRRGTVLVTLPYEPSRATRDEFRRLRRGDYVRIDAQVTGGRQVMLLRFVR